MIPLSEAPVCFREFSAIQPGDSVVLTKTIREADVSAFAALSGDLNPLHMDGVFAGKTSFQRRVVHGMLVASYVSTMVGMQLPGPGALWTEQSFRWAAPVFLDDTIEFALRVTHKSEGTKSLVLELKARNQNGTLVMEGNGTAVMLEQHGTTGEGPLCERVVFVSGASRGIGAAIATHLALAGAAVAVNYQSNAIRAEEVSHRIIKAGGRCVPLKADVSDAESVQHAIARAGEAFGKSVDVLVNNAGAPHIPKTFAESTWDDMQRQLDVSLRGAFHCTQAVLPSMRERRSGRIVNIGSALLSSLPTPQWTAFLVAKAALKTFTKALASELSPLGIRINMVSPGMTETESVSVIPERLRKVQAMQAPTRRLAVEGDIAQAVTFLCGPGADNLTGIDLPVCGGMSV